MKRSFCTPLVLWVALSHRFKWLNVWYIAGPNRIVWIGRKFWCKILQALSKFPFKDFFFLFSLFLWLEKVWANALFQFTFCSRFRHRIFHAQSGRSRQFLLRTVLYSFLQREKGTFLQIYGMGRTYYRIFSIAKNTIGMYIETFGTTLVPQRGTGKE